MARARVEAENQAAVIAALRARVKHLESELAGYRSRRLPTVVQPSLSRLLHLMFSLRRFVFTFDEIDFVGPDANFRRWVIEESRDVISRHRSYIISGDER
jgi:hypothetical protein